MSAATRFLAEDALALGLPVFPCDGDKKPLTKRGFKDASRDPASIRRMFAHRAATSIAVPTGTLGGFVVIDIDVKDGRSGLTWLDANRDAALDTRVHETRSGGLHLLFRQPGGAEIACSQSQIAPDVDVRGQGGYVIVPPSPGYRVAVKAPLAEMPAWLVAATRKKEPPPPRPRTPWDASVIAMDREAKRLASLLRVVSEARIGERHNRVFWTACRIAEAEARGELPGDVAFTALRDAAEGVGLEVREIEAAIRDARARACGRAAS